MCSRKGTAAFRLDDVDDVRARSAGSVKTPRGLPRPAKRERWDALPPHHAVCAAASNIGTPRGHLRVAKHEKHNSVGSSLDDYAAASNG